MWVASRGIRCRPSFPSRSKSWCCARAWARSWRLSGLQDCDPAGGSALSDLRVTDDRFALAIGETDGADRAFVEKLLSQFHPVTVEERDVISGKGTS